MSALAYRLGFAFEREARRTTVWGALLAATALAWALTVRGAVEMGNMPGTMGRGVPAFVGMWTVMMAAMMLPSVAPVGSLYVRSLRSRSTGLVAGLRLTSLVSGYLGVWATFGLVAFAAAWTAGRLAREAPGLAPWVGAGVLALCGIYQLTPLKERCLSHCRSPMGFLLHFGNYRGRNRDIRVGLYHGAYCLGCCWSLMVVMIAAGVMNLAWMAGLAAVIFMEKIWRYGKELGKAFGIALIVLALFIPSNPGLLPGLHLDDSMQTQVQPQSPWPTQLGRTGVPIASTEVAVARTAATSTELTNSRWPAVSGAGWKTGCRCSPLATAGRANRG